MTIDDKIRDKQNCNMTCRSCKDAAKMSVILSSKIEKYKCLTGKEILPSDQSRKKIKLSLIITL